MTSFFIPFAFMIAWTETPCLIAISSRVSPALTLYLIAEGAAVGTVGARVAVGGENGVGLELTVVAAGVADGLAAVDGVTVPTARVFETIGVPETEPPPSSRPVQMNKPVAVTIIMTMIPAMRTHGPKSGLLCSLM